MAVHRDWNKHQQSTFKSQNEATTIASSLKRVKKLKHSYYIDDNEKDISITYPHVKTMSEDLMGHIRQ